MSNEHKMPFGAEICSDGKVRFRLWAPKSSEVSLDLCSKSLPMARLDDGWFELVTGEAGPGTRYQFKIDRLQSVRVEKRRLDGAPLGGSGLLRIACWNIFTGRNLRGGTTKIGLPRRFGHYSDPNYAGFQLSRKTKLGLRRSFALRAHRVLRPAGRFQTVH